MEINDWVLGKTKSFSTEKLKSTYQCHLESQQGMSPRFQRNINADGFSGAQINYICDGIH